MATLSTAAAAPEWLWLELYSGGSAALACHWSVFQVFYRRMHAQSSALANSLPTASTTFKFPLEVPIAFATPTTAAAAAR